MDKGHYYRVNLFTGWMGLITVAGGNLLLRTFSTRGQPRLLLVMFDASESCISANRQSALACSAAGCWSGSGIEWVSQIERDNQLILSAAGEGIYGVQCEGDTTFVNPAAA